MLSRATVRYHEGRAVVPPQGPGSLTVAGRPGLVKAGTRRSRPGQPSQPRRGSYGLGLGFCAVGGAWTVGFEPSSVDAVGAWSRIHIRAGPEAAGPAASALTAPAFTSGG